MTGEGHVGPWFDVVVGIPEGRWRCPPYGTTTGLRDYFRSRTPALTLPLSTIYHQRQSASTYAAEPSRSHPSSCACSLSCWPRRRGTTKKSLEISGIAVMSLQSFSHCATGKISS